MHVYFFNQLLISKYFHKIDQMNIIITHEKVVVLFCLFSLKRDNYICFNEYLQYWGESMRYHFYHGGSIRKIVIYVDNDPLNIIDLT